MANPSPADLQAADWYHREAMMCQSAAVTFAEGLGRPKDERYRQALISYFTRMTREFGSKAARLRGLVE